MAVGEGDMSHDVAGGEGMSSHTVANVVQGGEACLRLMLLGAPTWEPTCC